MSRQRSFLTVTDQFCGAGGSSIGASAVGLEIRMAMNKTCRVCGLSLPRSDFYQRAGAPDGLRTDCKQCVKARARQSVERRTDAVAAYQANYRLANLARLRADGRRRQREYDRCDYYREYRALNCDTLHENARRYRTSHPERCAARRHGRRAISMTGESREFIAIILRDPCAYCGGTGGTVDHITPVSLGGTNAWENLTGACLSCNSSKNAQPLLHFLAERAHA